MLECDLKMGTDLIVGNEQKVDDLPGDWNYPVGEN